MSHLALIIGDKPKLDWIKPPPYSLSDIGSAVLSVCAIWAVLYAHHQVREMKRAHPLLRGQFLLELSREWFAMEENRLIFYATVWRVMENCEAGRSLWDTSKPFEEEQFVPTYIGSLIAFVTSGPMQIEAPFLNKPTSGPRENRAAIDQLWRFFDTAGILWQKRMINLEDCRDLFGGTLIDLNQLTKPLYLGTLPAGLPLPEGPPDVQGIKFPNAWALADALQRHK